MFDVGFFEILIVSAIALILLGPKDFQKALFALGTFISNCKSWFESMINNENIRENEEEKIDNLTIDGEYISREDKEFEKEKSEKE